MFKKAVGMLNGVSDLIVVMEGCIYFIEVKTEVGVQSKEQKEFEQRVKSLGFDYYLVRSVEQFKSLPFIP